MSKLGGGRQERQLKREERRRRRQWQKRSSAKGVEKPNCTTLSCRNPGTKSKAQRQT